jgi:hypothetical protein
MKDLLAGHEKEYVKRRDPKEFPGDNEVMGVHVGEYGNSASVGSMFFFGKKKAVVKRIKYTDFLVEPVISEMNGRFNLHWPQD